VIARKLVTPHRKKKEGSHIKDETFFSLSSTESPSSLSRRFGCVGGGVDSTMALCQLCNSIPCDKFISWNIGETLSLTFSD